MNGARHPSVEAMGRAAEALRTRMAILDADDLDVDAVVATLHDIGSTLNLLEDVPLPADDHGLGILGRMGGTIMRTTETLSTLIARERTAAGQVATAATRLAARRTSDNKVLASLLGLSVLLNALLAFVALR